MSYQDKDEYLGAMKAYHEYLKDRSAMAHREGYAYDPRTDELGAPIKPLAEIA